MKTKLLVLSLAVIILLIQPTLNLARIAHAEDQPQTSIAVFPSQIEEIPVGEYFSLNVSAHDCTDVYGLQVDINYDPVVLKTVGVNPPEETPFTLVALNTSNVFSEELNLTYNGITYGEVYFVAARAGDVSGVYGDVQLFTIIFQVLSPGSSSIQLIEYPGKGVGVGTYFMSPNFEEIVPKLYNSNYGQPTSTQTSTPSDSTDAGQVSSAFLLPSLIPLAALLLVVVKRKISRSRSNQ
jgi:hypothetical protein